jgi:hypothetical protein
MTVVLPVGWRRSANGTLMARSVLWRFRVGAGWMWCMPLTWGSTLERVTRIELALSAWEADVLPLNYTRAAGPPWPTAVRVCGNRAPGGLVEPAPTSYRNR